MNLPLLLLLLTEKVRLQEGAEEGGIRENGETSIRIKLSL
jgi:hypothetical protein